MNAEMKRFFRKMIINSLTTQQVEYLGTKIDPKFNLHRESGFASSVPVPRQNAAQTFMSYFNSDEDMVRIFSYMLQHEGERLYNRDLVIWGRDEFISMLRMDKWIYDPELKMFLLDPFYEHEINFLKKIRIIDLRGEINVDEIIGEIASVCQKMSIADLEWRVVLRLYDLQPKTGELIRKIIGMLLNRQQLQSFTPDMFVCLKELAINASKANYKILFEKHVTAPDGITAEKNYHEFLSRFRDEIDENGNTNLFELARKDDRFITITFQSTMDSIEMWVTNNQNITAIEKQQIMKKLGIHTSQKDSFLGDEDDELTEGAGLGITLILRVLQTYSSDPHPLKIVFYPEALKIGFTLRRSDLKSKLPDDQEQ